MASFFSGQSDWAVHGAGLFIDGKFAPRVNSPLSVLSKPQAASPRCISASGREPSPVTLEEPAGSRNAQRSRGPRGRRSLHRFTPTTGPPMPDPSMTCGSVTYSERCDFRCGSNSEVRLRNWAVRLLSRTDVASQACQVRKVPTGDIAC